MSIYFIYRSIIVKIIAKNYSEQIGVSSSLIGLKTVSRVKTEYMLLLGAMLVVAIIFGHKN